MSLNEQTLALPPSLMREVDKALEAWASNANTRRLWRADATLWTGGDEGDWLGWLDVAKISCATSNRCRNSPARCAPRNSPTCCSWAWADRAWAPRCWARASDRRRAIRRCTCSIPPTHSRCGVSSAASMQHTRCSSCRANRAPRSNRTCSWIIFSPRRRLPSAAPRPGISSPSPIRAATCKRRRSRKASAASFSAFQASADVIPCFPISAWCRWR